MKLKVLVKGENADFDGCMKGDWIDLRSAESLRYTSKPQEDGSIANLHNVRLGVCMKLPPGMEAVVVPRSSLPIRWGIIQANSFGVIDNAYCGDNDEWKLFFYPMRNGRIRKGDRLCQFKIQPSQKATFMQKLKWLLCSGIEFTKVDRLPDTDRGGFGSTGKR